MDKYRVLLGGIGDDAHSIGISLLKIGLEERGYLVTFLGIQNTIDDFLRYSKSHDIIMISCINGHSELYLNATDSSTQSIKSIEGKLWYLGGNLSVNKEEDYIVKLYLEKGFTRVFPKPISVEETFYYLKYDIEKYNIKPQHSREPKLNFSQNANILSSEISDDPIDIAVFIKERKAVLQTLETGKDVSYERACKNYNRENSLDAVLWNAHKSRLPPLLQPRTGVADVVKQVELFKTLYKANINVISVQLDAASRRLYFDKAKNGVELSLLSGNSMLNGFPVPIYGVPGVEMLAGCLELPFQIRGGAPDHRFVYEVGIAGGATGIEGSFLCYLLPYEKRISPVESLHYWKYVDRLCGIYLNDYNICINREFFGALTTTLLEPCIPIVINIVEALLGAKQGVRSFSIGIAEQGNRVQDIAALHVLSKMTNYYLDKYGFKNARVTSVFHQYMGAFPHDEVKAEQLITESAITATLGGATRMMTKTPVEAIKIPSAQENIRGLECARKGIQKAASVKLDHSKVDNEIRLIEVEVVSIMNAIEELGNGHISRGAIKALFAGILDIPFSPNLSNRGETIAFRNKDGAVRFAVCNNLPFPEAIKEFHYNELVQRMDAERDNKMYSILEKDLTRIWKGEFRQWPLDGLYIE